MSGLSHTHERHSWEVGHRLTGEPKRVTQEQMDRFESVAGMVAGAGDQAEGPVNIHTDSDKARSMGLERPVASGQMSFAYLHELLAREFGADFRQGGELAATFLKPVYAGDTVTAQGVVRQAHHEQGDKGPPEGRTTVALEVWVENEGGEKVAAGEARVTIPSPLT